MKVNQWIITTWSHSNKTLFRPVYFKCGLGVNIKFSSQYLAIYSTTTSTNHGAIHCGSWLDIHIHHDA